MKTMAISIFKTNALKVIAEVAETHERIIITKRGKAMAEIIPFHSLENEAIPGKLSSSLKYEKDIINPLGSNMWDVCK